MIVGNLVFDKDLEVGNVILTEEFKSMSSLLKADLMNDFSFELDKLHEEVYDEYCKQYRSRNFTDIKENIA